GKTGFAAVISLGILMGAFYLTCFVFIVGVLGTLLYAVTRVNIFSLMKYLGREYLLIVGTSSSEAALPRLIAKMEHLGVSKPVVGITVPTGYSFNLDGTAIYLTMASLFIASAMGADVDSRADRSHDLHDHRLQGRGRCDRCGDWRRSPVASRLPPRPR
ncbi:hypothetical protein HR12_44730, partial [Microbacterium sp. SUBG005]